MKMQSEKQLIFSGRTTVARQAETRNSGQWPLTSWTANLLANPLQKNLAQALKSQRLLPAKQQQRKKLLPQKNLNNFSWFWDWKKIKPLCFHKRFFYGFFNGENPTFSMRKPHSRTQCFRLRYGALHAPAFRLRTPLFPILFRHSFDDADNVQTNAENSHRHSDYFRWR